VLLKAARNDPARLAARGYTGAQRA